MQMFSLKTGVTLGTRGTGSSHFCDDANEMDIDLQALASPFGDTPRFSQDSPLDGCR